MTKSIQLPWKRHSQSSCWSMKLVRWRHSSPHWSCKYFQLTSVQFLTIWRLPVNCQTTLLNPNPSVLQGWYGCYGSLAGLVWCRVQSPGVLELNCECWRGHMLGQCSISPFGLQLGGSTLHTILINWRSPSHNVCLQIDFYFLVWILQEIILKNNSSFTHPIASFRPCIILFLLLNKQKNVIQNVWFDF